MLGDANYHDQPFSIMAPVIGADAAIWIPCRGYHNLLGVVQFQTLAFVNPPSSTTSPTSASRVLI